MSETPISVTAAARNFSDCINLVRYQGASFVLEKNGVPVARIVPVQSKTGQSIREKSRSKEPKPEEEIPNNDQKSHGDQEQMKHHSRPILNW